jgi:hypothetical protein
MTDVLRSKCDGRAKWMVVSVIAVALAACGGGGGGIASTPPAPMTPSPTPTPTPTSFSISAPARASTGPGAAAVLASPAGPSFTSGPAASTVFPLLQSAVVYGATSVKPDAAVNAAGGTASAQQGALSINIGAFTTADVRMSWSGYANLDWTRAGYWATGGGWWDYDDEVGRRGAFVTGYETPASAVPSTGTATFTGLAEGAIFYPGTSAGTTHCACNIVQVSGNASFTANFGTRNLSGSLTGMTAGSAPWNDVAFNSTITGNAFSGTTNVTNAPGSPASLSATAAGTVDGKFFGPAAQEAGAVWTLFDGTKAAIGTLTGKRP